MSKTFSPFTQYGQNMNQSPIDAYNFYKKNIPAAQETIENMAFNSAQESSANFAQNLLPKANAKKSFLGMNTSLLAGLVLGAGAAIVASNPKVQKAVVGTSVKVWAGLQGHIEEMKEQIHDAKAELSQEDE